MPIDIPITEFTEESFEVEIGAFENIGGQSVRVPIIYFDYGALDSLDDLIDEHREKYGTARHLFIAHGERQRDLGKQDGIIAFASSVLKSKKPGLKTYAIALAVNLPISENGSKVARMYGVSKQDIQQLVERTKAELGLKKTSTERSEEGKQNMSKRGFRK